MSEKQICPACTSYSSSVRMAFDAGSPCPFCGLSASAAAEVERARASLADETLKRRVSELIIENEQLRRKAGRFDRLLREVAEVADKYSSVDDR